MDWLKTEPAYLTFEAWVAKQEEDRKAGSMPCPACGTLNPKGAAICSKCGTVFEKAPEVPQAGEAVDTGQALPQDRQALVRAQDGPEEGRQGQPRTDRAIGDGQRR